MNDTQQIHRFATKAHGTSEPIPDASGTGMIESSAPQGALSRETCSGRCYAIRHHRCSQPMGHLFSTRAEAEALRQCHCTYKPEELIIVAISFEDDSETARMEPRIHG